MVVRLKVRLMDSNFLWLASWLRWKITQIKLCCNLYVRKLR